MNNFKTISFHLERVHYNATETYDGITVQQQGFVNWALHGSGVSASHSGLFVPQETAPIVHC